MFLRTISESLREEEVPDADGKASTRTVMKMHPALAPVKCAILPLVKNKAELAEKAQRIFQELKLDVSCQYDDKDAIGRRYRRQDAIGTPYCVTIDFDTLEDDAVTIRDRDTLEQKRIPIAAISQEVTKNTSMKSLLSQL